MSEQKRTHFFTFIEKNEKQCSFEAVAVNQTQITSDHSNVAIKMKKIFWSKANHGATLRIKSPEKIYLKALQLEKSMIGRVAKLQN